MIIDSYVVIITSINAESHVLLLSLISELPDQVSQKALFLESPGGIRIADQLPFRSEGNIQQQHLVVVLVPVKRGEEPPPGQYLAVTRSGHSIAYLATCLSLTVLIPDSSGQRAIQIVLLIRYLQGS